MEKVKITHLELENVKRVRAFAMDPVKDGLTVIGGRNCQGKTSVLDGIAYALGGEKRRPSNVQNDGGLAPARIDVTLSNGLRVTRGGAKCALTVTDTSGRKSGQRLLDSFVSEIALDLPGFLNAPAREKASVLLRLLGVEEKLNEISKREKSAYDARTAAGQIAGRARKHFESMAEYPEAPQELLSPIELTARLSEIMHGNLEKASARARRAALEDDIRRCTSRLQEQTLALERLQDELTSLRCQLENTPPPGEDEDPTEPRIQLAMIEEVNRKVRANMERSAAKDNALQAEAEVTRLTGEVDAAREERRKLLESAPMPLEGLSVEGGELVYKGQKWDCMSTMEQLRVGVAVCRSLKPECGFVLVDRLESFDASSLAEFSAWLENEGLQCIGTRVATDGTCDIIIEDGVSTEPSIPADIGVSDDVLGDW